MNARRRLPVPVFDLRNPIGSDEETRSPRDRAPDASGTGPAASVHKIEVVACPLFPCALICWISCDCTACKAFDSSFRLSCHPQTKA